jgi:hypothetical protein
VIRRLPRYLAPLVSRKEVPDQRIYSSSFPYDGPPRLYNRYQKVPGFISWNFLFVFTSVISVRVWEGVNDTIE